MNIRFIAEDQTSANTLGQVLVLYSNGTRQTFEGIRRADFFRWQATGYLNHCPQGVRLKHANEDDTEPLDESDEETNTLIADNDYLGQITGYRSPGY